MVARHAERACRQRERDAAVLSVFSGGEQHGEGPWRSREVSLKCGAGEELHARAPAVNFKIILRQERPRTRNFPGGSSV